MKDEGDVQMTFTGMQVNTREEGRQELQKIGIRAEEEEWSKMRLRIRREKSARIMMTVAELKVRVNRGLRRCMQGEVRVKGNEIRCEVRGEADEEIEWSTLEPAGEGSEDSMKVWCRLWAMLGVQEMHIRELVLLMMLMEWPDFEGEEIAVWASDAPRTVASAWKGSQAVRGQIRIRWQGAPISVGNRHVYKAHGRWRGDNGLRTEKRR